MVNIIVFLYFIGRKFITSGNLFFMKKYVLANVQCSCNASGSGAPCKLRQGHVRHRLSLQNIYQTGEWPQTLQNETLASITNVYKYSDITALREG